MVRKNSSVSLLVILIVLFLISSSSVFAATVIASADCGTTISSTGEYELTGDLSCAGDGIIFGVTGSSTDYVSLNCNGYSITGVSSSGTNGVYSSPSQYLEINNCEITGFENGIQLKQANYANVSNNIIYSVDNWGIVLINSDYPTIEENYAHDNLGNTALRFWDVNYAEVYGNNFSENLYGITIQTSSYNNFENNLILDSDSRGFFIKGQGGPFNEAIGNTLFSNIICSSSNEDFYAADDGTYIEEVTGADNYFGVSTTGNVRETAAGWPDFTSTADNNNYCDIDSDGDGVVDYGDVCNGYDDSLDSDSDGTPDGCDFELDDASCVDGFDNDGDGNIDCADDGCLGLIGPEGVSCEESESSYASCTDGFDTDGDGDIDTDDSDCACLLDLSFCFSEETCSDFGGVWDSISTYQCMESGVDSDGDGCLNEDEVEHGLNPTSSLDCPIAGDINEDYLFDATDINDFNLLLDTYYGESYSGVADMNGDGILTFADVLNFVAAYVAATSS